MRQPLKQLSIILSIMFLTACVQTVKAEAPTAIVEQEISTTATFIPQATQTEAPTITPTILFTPTPDMRLDPADWKKWPVIPHVSGKVADIFRVGQEKGRNPGAFSKIGDCQNVKEAFMGFFDRQEVYLAESQLHLQETLDHFQGYFNRDGYAVKGGLNVSSSLNPLLSDKETCQTNENTLMCEVRINNPAYAFVSFELWYDGRTAENYEGYLRQVLDYLISEGVVPILLTKADNVEGNHSINLTIAKLAYEYDLPMINWWYTAQTLPYNGLDTERDDKFHISSTAWTERSYDALEALDLVWKSTRDLQ